MLRSLVARLPVLALVLACCAELPAQGWSDRTAAGGPPPRWSHGMCYDPVRQYVLLSGGIDTSQPGRTDTWSWDGTAWQPRGTAPASFRSLVVHGSTNKVLGIAMQSPQSGGVAAYEWDGAQWTLSGQASVASWAWADDLTAAYDPVRQETVVVSRSAATINTVVVFDGTNWSSRTCTTGLPTLYTTGYARMLAWDPVALRIVCAQDEQSYILIGSTWIPLPAQRFYEWNGAGWNLRMPATVPARGGAMATDTTRSCVLQLDGEYPSSQTPGSNQPHHTWSYANGVSTRLTTFTAPAARLNASMAFDPVRGVAVLFGGYYQYLAMGDTWEFDLGPLATFTAFGTGCTGSRGVPQLTAQNGSLPRIGATFQAHLSNLPWTGPVFLLLGLSDTNYSGTPLPIDLAMLGAPGCLLRTSIEDVQSVANVLGTAIWSFTVPPVAGASFYVQALPLDPFANALGLTLSNGGHGVIGL